MPSEPVRPAVSRRRWVLLALGVVAVVAGTTLAIVADDGTSETSTATTEPTTTSTSSSTTSTTTTTVPVDPDVAALAGRQWVRLPVDGEPALLDAAPTLALDIDGSIRGYSGCEAWSARFDVAALGAGRFQYDDGDDHTSYCITRQTETLADADVQVSTADGSTLLTVTPPGGAEPISYVDAATLPRPTAAGVIGSWQQPGLARITFAEDRTVSVGACTERATWTFDPSSSVIINSTAVDSPEWQACARATISGSATTDLATALTLAEQPLTLTVRTFARMLLVTGTTTTEATTWQSSNVRWLYPASDVEPAFDLVRHTAYGFSAGTDVSVDYVIAQISPIAGPPSFDSDWYRAATIETQDYEDCFGGSLMRIVQWGDVSLGWIRLGGDSPGAVDRLWVIAVGDDRTFLESVRFDGVVPPRSGDTSATTPAIGSSIEDFAAAGLTLDSYTDAQGNPADPSRATSAQTAGAFVDLDRGTVTAIVVYNPGFC
ncbi:MAG: hypothetical protein ACO3C1_03625 [Ilumatobacteraceae bacterium]